MAKLLEGRVALVTGGGTGIGAAIAKRFAREGARVVICGRRAELLERVVKEIEVAGGSADAVPTDLTREESVRAFVRDAAERCGRLDVLVNNAVQMVIKPIADMSLDDWRESLGVGLDAAFIATREAMPIMAANGGGAISGHGLKAATSRGGMRQPGRRAWLRPNLRARASAGWEASGKRWVQLRLNIARFGKKIER